MYFETQRIALFALKIDKKYLFLGQNLVYFAIFSNCHQILILGHMDLFDVFDVYVFVNVFFDGNFLDIHYICRVFDRYELQCAFSNRIRLEIFFHK